jgi:GNAT superfamily N-acetyltransferase
MDSLRITEIDLADVRHTDPQLELLDLYARDPMGGGHGLDPAVRAQLIGALARVPGFHGALAWHEGRAVGLLHGFTGFSTFAARPLFNVHDIVVREGWRGRGVGQALLAWAETLARRLGCCKLTLEVLAGNERALRSYARAGYEPYELDPAAGHALLMQRKL